MKHQYIRQKNIRQKIKWMLVLLMAVSLSACGVKEEKNRQQAEENSAEESISKDGTYEIAFISGNWMIPAFMRAAGRASQSMRMRTGSPIAITGRQMIQGRHGRKQCGLPPKREQRSLFHRDIPLKR